MFGSTYNGQFEDVEGMDAVLSAPPSILPASVLAAPLCCVVLCAPGQSRSRVRHALPEPRGVERLDVQGC